MTNEEKEIKIKTLTPLWTGDIDQNCNRIKETGIIGSLRWWYEALVRGLGGYACDPTDSNCQFNYEAYKESENTEDGFIWDKHPERNMCDVCKLFGCNGWKKRFSLRVEDNFKKIDLNFLETLKTPGVNDTTQINLGWWYDNTYPEKEAIISNDFVSFNFRSNSAYYSDQQIQDIMAYLLKFISEAGGLGAKTQNGFGIIDTKFQDVDLENGLSLIKESISSPEDSSSKFTLSNYFKFEVVFPEYFFKKYNFEKWVDNKENLETGQMIKYLSRIALKNNSEQTEKICENYEEIEENSDDCKGSQENNADKIIARHLIGSDLNHKKRISLINFSNMWKEGNQYRMRIWGFLPKEINFNNYTTKIDVGKTVSVLKTIIDENLDVESFSEPVYGGNILEEVIL